MSKLDIAIYFSEFLWQISMIVLATHVLITVRAWMLSTATHAIA